MARTDAIPVGAERAGDAAGPTVELPVPHLLAGRGFVTGAAAADRAATAGLIATGLLDRGHPLLVVDIDGSFADLGRREGVVHAGADGVHDRQVGVDTAETPAEPALERGVPVVLDVSSFRDEQVARSLLTALAGQLLATAGRVDRSLPVFLPAFHELVPAGGATDECGRSFLGLARRGPGCGCGVVAISARPSRVRSEYLGGCDWELWHRHPRRSDSRVADRRLGPVDRELVEVLDRDEAYLRGEWESRVRKVAIERDGRDAAGAAVGLGTAERSASTSGIVDGGDSPRDDPATSAGYERRIRDLKRSLRTVTERLQTIERALAEETDQGNPGGETADQAPTEGRGTDPVGDALAEDADEGLLGVDSEALPADTDGTDDSGIPAATDDRPSVNPFDGDRTGAVRPEEREVVRRLRGTIADLDAVTRGMLAHYREHGPASPLDAHVAAGGDADRTAAYRRNGALREADLIEHAGRGGYTDRLRNEIVEAHDDRLDPGTADAAIEAVAAALPPANPRTAGDGNGEPNRFGEP